MATKRISNSTRRPRLQVMLNSRMMRMPVTKVDRIVKAANDALHFKKTEFEEVISESKRSKVNFLLRQDARRLTKLMVDKHFIPKTAFEKINVA